MSVKKPIHSLCQLNPNDQEILQKLLDATDWDSYLLPKHFQQFSLPASTSKS